MLFIHMLPVSFTGSYTEDEPNFPQENYIIFTEKGEKHRQGSEFQGLFKT